MPGWGLGFFRTNADGHVTVHADGDPARGLDLYQLALDLQAQGVGLPLLLRFSDILRARISQLAEVFAKAIAEFGYDGSYTTVYPIKVNQQRHVVQEIVEFGAAHGVGLECGSKPELQAVLGLHESTQHLIVCNGYKDEEFMRLAMMGQRLGHQVFIVVEQLHELDLLLAVADEMGVTPTLGVRIKLATEGSGRWAKSGGEKSKFGLSAVELMRLLTRLEQLGRKDLLRLVHFHLGSQITDIRHVKAGLEEIARYYGEIHAMGFKLTHVDVGGGLGVDYDGSRSTRPASVNYTMREYASDVVYTIGTACREHDLPMPHLISESGRALTAHHSLLLVNVIDVESQVEPVPPAIGDDPHPLLREMAENLDGLTLDRLDEAFHDVIFAKERTNEYFASGVFTLRDKADAEQLYLCTLTAIQQLLGDDRTSASRGHGPHRRHAGRPLLLAISRCSSRFPTTGPSTSSSRSCRSTGSASGRRGGAPSRTSPATPTASSTGSPGGGRASRRSSCTPAPTATPTSWASSSRAPTRRSSATSTISSATPTRCTCGSRRTATR